MKIYDLNLTGSAAAGMSRTQETQKSGTSGTSRAGTAAGADDHVVFSSALGRLSKAISADDAQRSNRVRELAAQYASGGYRVDAAAVSRAMLTEALAPEKV